MKVIIFGLGDIYSRVKHYFYEANAKIVALIDNDRKLLGTLMDGHVVDDPKQVWQYQFDYIVITSSHAVEMRQQLIELGVQPEQIMHFRDYIGSIPIEIPFIPTNDLMPHVLILSNELGYHGGPITCVNLARIFRKNGFKVTIAVPSAEQDFLNEVSLKEDLQIIVIENLNFLNMDNLEWTSGYTYVFANTFIMAMCAIKIARKKKVYLWLHESIDSYVGYDYWFDEILKGVENEQLVIGAVSDVAGRNFLSIYPVNKKIGVFPYGIDDRYKENDYNVSNEITTFTVVANHVPLKGLDVLLDALNLISDDVMRLCKFLFVGKTYDSEYGQRVRDYFDKNAVCEFLGELPRNKLFEVYCGTDIIIVPSRRDTMSLVATEAMMLKKPCIISDSIGMARYIKHKYNGLIFQNENKEELARMICWCLENREELKEIAENARKTFETWFTMEVFGNRVLNVIDYMR